MGRKRKKIRATLVLPERSMLDRAISPLDVDLDNLQDKVDTYLNEFEELNKNNFIEEKIRNRGVQMDFSKIKSKFQTVWEVILDNKVVVVVSVVNILIVTLLTSFNHPSFSYNDLVKRNIFSDAEKREQAKTSYAKIRGNDFDKNEMLFAWVKLVGKWRYQMGGSNQFGVGDCVGAVDFNLEYWGSLLPRENVTARVKRFEQLRKEGRSTKISSTFALKPFDVIFIQSQMGNPTHEALIFDVTPAGQIRYLDVNVYNQGWNLNTVTMGDPKIFAIYEMTAEAWLAE
jgi:hypothetical protein